MLLYVGGVCTGGGGTASSQFWAREEKKNDTADRWMDGWMDGWARCIYGEKESQMVGTWLAVLQWWKRCFFFVPYKSCDSRIEWKNICVSFIYIQYWSIDFLDPSYWFCMSFFTFGQVDDVQKRGNKRNKRLDKKDKTFFVWTFAASVAGPVFVYWGGGLSQCSRLSESQWTCIDLSHFFLWNKTTRKETTCQYMTLWRRWLFLDNITVACRFYLFIWNVNMSIFLYGGLFLLFFSKKDYAASLDNLKSRLPFVVFITQQQL